MELGMKRVMGTKCCLLALALSIGVVLWALGNGYKRPLQAGFARQIVGGAPPILANPPDPDTAENQQRIGLGVVPRGSHVSYRYWLVNSKAAPVTIDRVDTTC